MLREQEGGFSPGILFSYPGFDPNRVAMPEARDQGCR